MYLLWSLILTFILLFVFWLLAEVLKKKFFIISSGGSVFECGVSSVKNYGLPFSIRFFFLSLLFLIFDVELVLLFPYLAVLLFSLSGLSFLVFMSFLLILCWGLYFEWDKSLLFWNF